MTTTPKTTSPENPVIADEWGAKWQPNACAEAGVAPMASLQCGPHCSCGCGAHMGCFIYGDEA